MNSAEAFHNEREHTAAEHFGDSPQAMLQAQARKGGKEEYLIIATHLEDIELEKSFYTIEISSLG